MEFVEKAKLIAKKEGLYTVYVFEKINSNGYIMCTRLPNWQTSPVNEGSVGFLLYEFIKSGDKYYDKYSNTFKINDYSNIYFINFIEE
jgi:hypothetical protein